MTISPKRAGYLRLAGIDREHAGPSPSGAVSAMWRKLEAEGLVERTADGCGFLTARGHLALAEFDAALPDRFRKILNVLRRGGRGSASMTGMKTLVDARLVIVDQYLAYDLSLAGRAAADPIGEIRYFMKSGRRVEVLGQAADAPGMLTVRRIDGESVGKEMCVPRDSLATEAQWIAMAS